ncbi:hypothetical protein HPB50_014612 [Hyalomma asiaticum]|uniref:Uncharacterized protein n=1 Tax=Hyalomma asiaticum TaxID=266040 RepID=A0ACB7TKN3_HYAAI|nr:hypothetical protein HPB50_014612 [Hyalomma asiaticum]
MDPPLKSTPVPLCFCASLSAFLRRLFLGTLGTTTPVGSHRVQGGGRRGGSAGILHLHCLGPSSLDSSARKGETRLRLLPSPVGQGTRLAAAHLAPSNHWTLNFPFCAPLSSCVA